MTDQTIDFEDRIRNCDSHLITGIDSVIHYFTLQHQIVVKEKLTFLANKLMADRKPRFKVAFITNLSWAKTLPTKEVQNVIVATENLLHSKFSDVDEGDIQNITSLLKTSKRTSETQNVVIAVYGYAAKSEDLEVVSAALGAYDNKSGGYVAYLATTKNKYSISRFGTSADGQPFEGRGLAKLVLAMFQFVTYWKTYKKCKNIYLHCAEEKVARFQGYGFKEVSATDKNEWPASVKQLHVNLGISVKDVALFELKSMVIDKAILGDLDKDMRFSFTMNSQLSTSQGNKTSPLLQVPPASMSQGTKEPSKMEGNATIESSAAQSMLALGLSLTSSFTSSPAIVLPNTTSQRKEISDKSRKVLSSKRITNSDKKKQALTKKRTSATTASINETIPNEKKRKQQEKPPKEASQQNQPPKEALQQEQPSLTTKQTDATSASINKRIPKKKERILRTEEISQQEQSLQPNQDNNGSAEKEDTSQRDQQDEQSMPKEEALQQELLPKKALQQEQSAQSVQGDKESTPNEAASQLEQPPASQLEQPPKENAQSPKDKKALQQEQSAQSKENAQSPKEALQQDQSAQSVQGDEQSTPNEAASQLEQPPKEQPQSEQGNEACTLKEEASQQEQQAPPSNRSDDDNSDPGVHLSGALTRKIYSAFSQRKKNGGNGGRTSDVHNEIKKTYRNPSWTKELWALVEAKIDELLINVDWRDRLSRFVDKTGKSLSNSFKSQLTSLTDEHLHKIASNESQSIRDAVEDYCCGMLPNGIWVLAEAHIKESMELIKQASAKANQPTIEEEVFNPSDAQCLERLTSLPQSVKDIIDAFQKRPIKRGENVLGEVVKKLNCAMTSNFQQLITQYFSDLLETRKSLRRTTTTATTETEVNESKEAAEANENSLNSGDPPKGNSGENEECFVEQAFALCSNCNRYVRTGATTDKCFKCNSFFHHVCGSTYKPVERHSEDQSSRCCCQKCVDKDSICLCLKCATPLQAIPYRTKVQTSCDAQLSLSWCLPRTRERSTDPTYESGRHKKPKLSVKDIRERAKLEEKRRLEKAVELQHWLTGIASIKYLKSAKKYIVKSNRNGTLEEKLLHAEFVDQGILLNNREYKKEVKSNRSSFHDVPDFVKQNVLLRDKLWSGPTALFKAYQDCLSCPVWTEIKINFAGGKKNEDVNYDKLQFVEQQEELTDPKRQYYVSLRNKNDTDKSSTVIEFVPAYILFCWRVQVGDTEMNTTMDVAGKRKNKWTTIPEGRSSFHEKVPRNLLTIHYKNTFLQGCEATCVIDSLANALMYINHADAAYILMSKTDECLMTNRRLQFVANVMSSLHYRVERLTDVDILSNISAWPTVCGLQGSDGAKNHAVAVCGEVLFDSNVALALQLNRNNLDWCCGAEGVVVEYVKVHLAYRFSYKNKY